MPRCLFLAGWVLLLASCRTVPQESLKRYEYEEPAMGTRFRLVFYASSPQTARDAAAAAFERIARLNTVMSDYDARSEIRRFAAQPAGTPVPISQDLHRVLARALQAARQTGGAYDPTASPVVRLWREARKTGEMPDPEALAGALQRVGFDRLILGSNPPTARWTKPGMELDLGGIGKGVAADAALQVLRTNGIQRALVAAGGDLAIGAPPPGKRGWRVEISPYPEVREHHLLSHCGVSTSGDLEQVLVLDGVRYSHIVHPKTGLGLTNQVAVSVRAPTATDSDPVATAMCVMGVERGNRWIESRKGYAALFVWKEGDRVRSRATSAWRR